VEVYRHTEDTRENISMYHVVTRDETRDYS